MLSYYVVEKLLELMLFCFHYIYIQLQPSSLNISCHFLYEAGLNCGGEWGCQLYFISNCSSQLYVFSRSHSMKKILLIMLSIIIATIF